MATVMGITAVVTADMATAIAITERKHPRAPSGVWP
jgi:hypothetical protein